MAYRREDAGPFNAWRRAVSARALHLLAAEGSIPMYASGNQLAARLRGLDHLPERV